VDFKNRKLKGHIDLILQTYTKIKEIKLDILGLKINEIM
jgi:hypothetical protein